MMEILKLVLLSFAVASAAITITKSPIFESFRLSVEKRSKKLGEGIKCPYCVSHWLAMLAVITCQPMPMDVWWGFNMVADVFVIVTLATPLCWVIFQSGRGISALSDSKKTNRDERDLESPYRTSK
jgi:hypothetical protein